MSTQIKTPAEIAEEISDGMRGHYTDLDSARYDAAFAAIEADRAQRAAIPYSLIDAVGADFQDGEALWFYPSEQVPGRFDAVIYHANSEHPVRYSYDGPTGIVTVNA